MCLPVRVCCHTGTYTLRVPALVTRPGALELDAFRRSQCTMHTGIHILTHAETRHTGSAGRKNKSDGRKKKDHRSQALTAGNCVRVCVSTRVPMHTCRDTYQIDRYVSIYVCECVYEYIWRHIPARAARDAASEPGICGELRT